MKFTPPEVTRIDFSSDGQRVEVRVQLKAHEQHPEGDRTQIVIKCVLPHRAGDSLAQLRERAENMALSLLSVEIAEPPPQRTLEEAIRAQLDRNQTP
jgi:hypothetical protein